MAFGLTLAEGDVRAAVVYSNAFELAEGYDSAYALKGQQGWLGDGTGGSGVWSNLFGYPEYGQQAYVGLYEPLILGEPSLAVWQPLNLTPLSTDTPIVRFSVWMEIFDSFEYLSYDRFQWSVFATNGAGTDGISTNGTRWFTIDFNNWDSTINYRLQNSNAFASTEWTFNTDALYRLQVLMDFSQNLWSATIGDTVVMTNQPITTTGAPLSLGAVAAVWVYRETNYPGDNYMVFDDYTITRERSEVPWLTPGERAGNSFSLRLDGRPGRRYAVEATTNFTTWTALRTNTADLADGTFDYIDRDARGPRRFYRGRLVP